MKRRICVKSMGLGAVIMLIGMWVSPLISPPITAQHNGVFDKIQCRKIEVIDKDGETTIIVEDGGVFVGGKNGGIVFMSTR